MDSLSRSLFNAVSKGSILKKDWYEMPQGREQPSGFCAVDFKEVFMNVSLLSAGYQRDL